MVGQPSVMLEEEAHVGMRYVFIIRCLVNIGPASDSLRRSLPAIGIFRIENKALPMVRNRTRLYRHAMDSLDDFRILVTPRMTAAADGIGYLQGVLARLPTICARRLTGQGVRPDCEFCRGVLHRGPRTLESATDAVERIIDYIANLQCDGAIQLRRIEATRILDRPGRPV